MDRMTGEPDGGYAGTRDPSRRSVLRGAAGIGVAGAMAAVATGGPALAAVAKPARGTQPAHGTQTAESGRHGAADPVVVHLRDAGTGELDIFRGTSHTRLRDPDLAARLARASR
jgi:hypothetical protein